MAIPAEDDAQRQPSDSSAYDVDFEWTCMLAGLML